MGCPVHIAASVDREKNKLVVLAVNLQHTHETNVFIAGTYPENRRLDEAERGVCSTLLDLGVSARKVCSLLKGSSGKLLTLRDIYNQAQRTRRTVHNTAFALTIVIRLITWRYDCQC